MNNNKIIFAGAGPGAVDLMTVRCRNAIENAEIIIYAGSLVNPDVLQFASKDCEIHDSASMTLDDVIDVMQKGMNANKKVLRLHTGDPAIYGAVTEQFNKLDKLGIDYEVIPGVSSSFTSAAALKSELTLPGVSQTIILTRRAGRTPVPPKEDLKRLASHQATMAIFLSIGNIDNVVSDLLAGGYTKDTAIAVVYRVSWPDEKIIRGSLANIADKVKEANITRQGMIIVGDVLKREGELSALYHPGFAHGYRDASSSEAPVLDNSSKLNFTGNVAVYALTESGAELAKKVYSTLPDAQLFISEKWNSQDVATSFKPEKLDDTIKQNWSSFKAHIFIMASGIVLRKIKDLIEDKTKDPAVICCDDCGNYCISLLSGHLGGANRLTNYVAEQIGAIPVVTTSTDVHNITAFDEIASANDWQITNPEMIKTFNSMLLENKKIAIYGPIETVDKLSANENTFPVENISVLDNDVAGIVTVDADESITSIPQLKIRSL